MVIHPAEGSLDCDPASTRNQIDAGDRETVSEILCRHRRRCCCRELVDWFNAVDLTYRTELRELEARAAAKQDLADTRADLIKWMFLFWLGSVAASGAGRFF